MKILFVKFAQIFFFFLPFLHLFNLKNLKTGFGVGRTKTLVKIYNRDGWRKRERERDLKVEIKKTQSEIFFLKMVSF